MRYDPSNKLDRAVRDILAKTDDDYLGGICMDRLIGRGYDDDIRAYIKRRLPYVSGQCRDLLVYHQRKLDRDKSR